MQIERGSGRLSFVRSLYENAKNKYAPVLQRLELWQEQYRGSTQLDGATEQACAVRNITYEIIESQIDATIPAPKIDPKRYSERNDRNAKSVERLCAQLRNELPFEELNDMDERYTYILGGSVWLVEWDHSVVSQKEVGAVRVSCLSPKDFIPQPNMFRVEDMEYCFLRFSTTREELCRRFGVSRDVAMLAEAEAEGDFLADDDTVTVVICFYRDDEGHIGRFVFSGDALLEDTPRYYGRKRAVCPACEREAHYKGKRKAELKAMGLQGWQVHLIRKAARLKPIKLDRASLFEMGGKVRGARLFVNPRTAQVRRYGASLLPTTLFALFSAQIVFVVSANEDIRTVFVELLLRVALLSWTAVRGYAVGEKTVLADTTAYLLAKAEFLESFVSFAGEA